MSKNSTNVRLIESATKAVFGLLNPVAPEAGGWLAERMFFTPRRIHSRRVSALLSTGARFDVRSGDDRIAAWRWGHGPAVALVHGWNGLGGSLGALVDPLVRSGHSVVAFDAPGHGLSGGRLSSLVQFASALSAVADAVGPLHAVVSHSLGGAAVALALHDGLPVRGAALIAPPAEPTDWTRRFAARFGASDDVMARMRARTEARLGRSFEELNVPRLVRGLDVPALIVHDRDDEDVAWRDGEQVAHAWPGASLLLTGGLGHVRVLRDAAIVGHVVRFIEGLERPVNDACPGTLCERCQLEAELFDPALRLAVA